MSKTESRLQILCCALLCLACGVVDAIGYLQHGVFAANMTGNTVLLGIDLARGAWDGAFRHALPLLAFFVGAVGARIVLVRSGLRRWLALLVEAILIGLAAALAPATLAALLVIALAMGVQAVAMTHFGGLAVSTVVVTSTLARIAEALADRLAGRGRTNPAPGAHIGIWSMTWVCYLVGALTAGLAVKTPAWAMAVSAGLVAVAALVAARASAAATPARP